MVGTTSVPNIDAIQQECERRVTALQEQHASPIRDTTEHRLFDSLYEVRVA